MNFRDAVSNWPIIRARTNNGMPTLVSSGNVLVDLFSAIGSSRGKDLKPQFDAAYALNREKTLKILLWARDIRGGAGERQIVRDLLRHLEDKHPADVEMLIPLIPFFGRWDDLLVFHTAEMRQTAYGLIAEALTDPATSALVSKWCPRKGKLALELEDFLGLRPMARGFHYTEGKAYPGKAYRAMLSSLSNAVEQQMCAKQWDEIVFDHVPSLAAARYQKAFNRRCLERYKLYKAGLVKGTTKINAGAVYPYDVIKSIETGDRDVAKAQWEALPNLLGEQNMLAMVDVSGSMLAKAGGGNVSNLQVATSLGLYIADKAKGAFKDCFLTFSGSPQIEVLKGDILAKYGQMCRSHWTMNTNLMGAFIEILKVAKAHHLDATMMPEILLIISDMEFDQCTSGKDQRAMDSIRDMYETSGYHVPKIVFWNLNARVGNSPVSHRENGTSLISGFSPAIMKSVLKAAEIKANDFTPESVMEQTIANDRYDVIDKDHRHKRDVYAEYMA
jgi:hypothetical protein